MRIRRFTVAGYKNLTQTIQLNNLEPVTVFYGANNVGKSNLLEALALPFVLLGLGNQSNAPLPIDSPEPLYKEPMMQAGYDPADIFTFGRPTPITIELELELDHDQLQAEGIRTVHGVTPITIACVLDPEPPTPSWKLTKFHFSDGIDAASADSDHNARSAARKFSLFLTRNYLVDKPRIQRLDSARLQLRGEYSKQMQSILLELYDAQESIQEFQRWSVFKESLLRFRDVLDADEVRALYNRREGTADIVLQRGNARIPTRLLGTGIQQLIYLLGRLLTSGASVVAIEEPEANLAFGLQLKLRKVLHDIATDPRNPSQLFFTSHSPGFQLGTHFYMMESTSRGPQVNRRLSERIMNATGFALSGHEHPEGSAPQTWVTRDGLVRLPEHVREKLGVLDGGGVAFLPDGEGVGYRIMNDAQALKEIGWSDEPG